MSGPAEKEEEEPEVRQRGANGRNTETKLIKNLKKWRNKKTTTMMTTTVMGIRGGSNETIRTKRSRRRGGRRRRRRRRGGRRVQWFVWKTMRNNGRLSCIGRCKLIAIDGQTFQEHLLPFVPPPPPLAPPLAPPPPAASPRCCCCCCCCWACIH